LDVLIEAVARVDGASLEVVGDGPCRASLEQLARRPGVRGRVRLLSVRPHSDVFQMLRSSDALLLKVATGAPARPIEALACWTPVRAPATGGTSEVVLDGDNGLVLREATAQVFASALARLRTIRICGCG